MAAMGIAIVGCGIIVREHHFLAVSNCSGLKLQAVYSRSRSTAESLLAHHCPNDSTIGLYSDDSPGHTFDELLSQPSIVAMVIALPIEIQPRFVRKALEAGKHVLAEKPLAKDVATAQDLLNWLGDMKGPATLAVAEQWRFLAPFLRGDQIARSLGDVLGIRVQFGTLIRENNRYLQTAWRRQPSYQGGFLLDGGVHFVAAMRLLLGPLVRVHSIVAFATRLNEALPPVDTIDASMRLTNGATGSFSASFATTFQNSTWQVACQRGSVAVAGSKITVTPIQGSPTVEELSDSQSPVEQELHAWKEDLAHGTVASRQSPAEALADLELVEAMLKSAANGGEVVTLLHQV